MKKFNSFLWTFVFGLPTLLSIGFFLWILLLIKPETTYNALSKLTKFLKDNKDDLSA